MTRAYQYKGSFRLIYLALTALNFHNTQSILTQVNLNMLTNSIKTQIGTRPTCRLPDSD
jgi:hypothetical protein